MAECLYEWNNNEIILFSQVKELLDLKLTENVTYIQIVNTPIHARVCMHTCIYMCERMCVSACSVKYYCILECLNC